MAMALLSCSPTVDFPDASDEDADNVCPFLVVVDTACPILQQVCPANDPDKICQCIAYEWRCFVPDAGPAE